MIAIVLFISLYILYSRNKFINQYRKKIFTALIILTILLTTATPLFLGNKLAGTIHKDIRIPIWQGAINLFIDNPIMGIGSPSYETSYATYRPIGYFLRSHYFAPRTQHPHNQLLYYAGSYGFFGLLALSILWLYPIFYFFRHYSRFTVVEQIIFFAYIIISAHGMVDMVIVQWPTMQLFFILQGIIWGYTFKYKKNTNTSFSTTIINRKTNILFAPICYILAFLFLISAINTLYSNVTSSYYNRNAEISTIRNWKSASITNKHNAIDANNKAKYIYDAGMQALLILGDYRLAYNYFSILENHPMSIVVHLNKRQSDCLMQMGRKREALQYLKKESIVFPLASLPLYKQILLERELGKNNDAEKTAFKLIQQLKFKGLKLSNMKKILANPELDNRFHLINKKNNR